MNSVKACVFAVFALIGFCATGAAQTDLEKIRSATNAERNSAIREILHRGKPPTLAQRLAQDREATFEASVLTGIDALGRVAIATDADGDGIADVYFLLTAKERLPGPVTRLLPRAKVHYSNGSLSIESNDRDYALVVTGAGMKPLQISADQYAEFFELNEAEELTGTLGGAGSTNALHMTAISHADVGSWPVSFWLDTMQPATGTVTCPDCSFCRNLPSGTSGGACLTEGQEQCNVSPSTCSANDIGCFAVVCHSNSNKYDFACCSCAGPLSLCRCLQCEPPPCGVTGCG
jgi:hypothetical protein